MPILAAIGAAILGVLIWYFRFRGPDGIGDIFNAANDARLAARRFGYQRRRNKSAIQSIDDARLAAAGLLVKVAEDEGSMTRRQEMQIEAQMEKTFTISTKDASEYLAFGRWVSGQDDSHRAWEKLLNRLVELGGPAVYDDIERMVQKVASVGNSAENQTAVDILSAIASRRSR